ncbi:helix-turn-helix transcriptional regulator [Vibrio sp. 10N.286.49.B1]|uniref:helix-turn-helix transcriptional regulator n=1 Tax=unclassified Vibrio TaxID=2614977 RepID=UPI0013001451|nr:MULTISPECIES: AraC family transcriptional regulator [unclassified Vibrio]
MNGKMYESLGTIVLFIPSYSNVGLSFSACDNKLAIEINRFAMEESLFRPLIDKFDIGGIRKNDSDGYSIEQYFLSAKSLVTNSVDSCVIHALFTMAIANYIRRASPNELANVISFPHDIDRIANAMRMDISKKWSAEELCQSINMTFSQLQRVLHKENITFSQLLKVIRLKYSLRLLYSGESIKTSAYSSGFYCPNYYSRVFKKYYGFSPSEIRKSRALSLMVPEMTS